MNDTEAQKTLKNSTAIAIPFSTKARSSNDAGNLANKTEKNSKNNTKTRHIKSSAFMAAFSNVTPFFISSSSYLEEGEGREGGVSDVTIECAIMIPLTLN
jgi:hypothetical protein